MSLAALIQERTRHVGAKKHRWMAYCLIIAILLTIALSMSASASAVIKAGSEVDYPPFCLVDANGNATGFSVELLNAVVETMGMKIQYKTGIWNDVKGWLESGEVQVLPLVGRTPEREASYDFTVPYMSLYGAIVVREGTTGISSMEDLRGKAVGVMKGDNAEEFLRRNDFGVVITQTATFDEALEQLSAGSYDAVVMQRLVAIRLINEKKIKGLAVLKQPIQEFKQDFCFAVREGDRETLATLNEGLAIVTADGTYSYLHSKWFASMELPTDRELIIGARRDYSPFSFEDDQGRPAGYLVDVIKAIADLTGLDIEIRLDSFSGLQNGLEQGKMDAALGIQYSPERDLDYDFSASLGEISQVAVSRKGEGPPPEDLKGFRGKKVVVTTNGLAHDILAANGEDVSFILAGSHTEALKALASGQGDFALLTSIVARSIIKKEGMTDLLVGTKSIASSKYAIAVNKGNKALVNIIDEGLKALDESGELRELYDKWLGIYEPREFDAATLVRFVLIGILPFAAFGLLALAWVRTLRRQVGMRTEQLKASGKLLSDVIDSIAAPVFFKDSEGSYLGCNKSFAKVIGLDSMQIMGKKDDEIADGRLRDVLNRYDDVLSEQGEVPTYEAVIEGTDGQEAYYLVRKSVYRDDKGEALGIVGAMLEITDLKRTQRALEKQQKRMKQILDEFPSGVCIVNSDYEIEYANPVMTRQFGDPAGRKCYQYLNEIEQKCARCRHEMSIPGKIIRMGKYFERNRCYYDVTDIPMINEDGSVSSLEVYHDVTERKLSEDEITKNQSMLSETESISHIGSWEWEKGSEKMNCSDEVFRILGKVPAPGIAPFFKLAEVFEASTLDAVREAFAEVLASGVSKILNLPVSEGEAAGRMLLLRLQAGRNLEGKVDGLYGSLQDVTETTQMLNRITHMNRVLSSIRNIGKLLTRVNDSDALIVEATRILVRDHGYADSLIVLRDDEGKCRMWSSGIKGGCLEKLAKMVAQGARPECFGKAQEASEGIVLLDRVLEGCEGNEEIRGLCAKLSYAGADYGFLVVISTNEILIGQEEMALFAEMASDISFGLHTIRNDEASRAMLEENQRLQDLYAQSQKMESIGRLAEGIAHDYNNMLGVIIGNSEIALEQADADDECHKSLEAIHEAALRASATTRQLFTFAGKQSTNPELIDLNELIEGKIENCKGKMRKEVELSWKPGGGTPLVMMDRQQAEQVLSDLCTRANKAITGDGKLSIATSMEGVIPEATISRGGVGIGDYVVITFEDSGKGLSDDELTSLFEPFASSTVNPAGSMDMAILYSIVKQNGGFVEVESEPDKGSIFKVFLPKHNERADFRHQADSKLPMEERKVILLVEDEPAILRLAKTMLERGGYDVVTAESPSQAIEIAKQRKDLALLISDLIMPEMNGSELAEVIKAELPDISTMFISGHFPEAIEKRMSIDKGIGFLQKPFTMTQLHEKVEQVLAGRVHAGK